MLFRSLVNQAKNAQALLYDAKIDVLDSPLSENGLKPLIMKAATLALQGDVPRHMILNTLNSFASKYHNYIVSDNQGFVKTNTTYRSGFGLPFSFSNSKKKYIFSATGGDLFLIDHYPNHVIIDKLSRLIEAVSKGSTMYGRILYSLDEEFAKNLAEVLKSRFDFVIKSMEAMSLSSLSRYGAHSTSVGFSFDEDYFAEYSPFEEHEAFGK